MKKLLFIFCCVFFISKNSFAQPANNNCASATALTYNGACASGTTASATTQAGESLTCYAGAGQTV
ncbi:MAG TPA: hypothetical protein PK649_08620 [Vicingus sp.]|nr:hypothetical protein [Vicingus sp.]HRP61652.1 hypothetical protein [Vicingus sp.]